MNRTSSDRLQGLLLEALACAIDAGDLDAAEHVVRAMEELCRDHVIPPRCIDKAYLWCARCRDFPRGHG